MASARKKFSVPLSAAERLRRSKEHLFNRGVRPGSLGFLGRHNRKYLTIVSEPEFNSNGEALVRVKMAATLEYKWVKPCWVSILSTPEEGR